MISHWASVCTGAAPLSAAACNPAALYCMQESWCRVAMVLLQAKAAQAELEECLARQVKQQLRDFVRTRCDEAVQQTQQRTAKAQASLLAPVGLSVSAVPSSPLLQYMVKGERIHVSTCHRHVLPLGLWCKCSQHWRHKCFGLLFSMLQLAPQTHEAPAAKYLERLALSSCLRLRLTSCRRRIELRALSWVPIRARQCPSRGARHLPEARWSRHRACRRPSRLSAL